MYVCMYVKASTNSEDTVDCPNEEKILYPNSHIVPVKHGHLCILVSG